MPSRVKGIYAIRRCPFLINIMKYTRYKPKYKKSRVPIPTTKYYESKVKPNSKRARHRAKLNIKHNTT